MTSMDLNAKAVLRIERFNMFSNIFGSFGSGIGQGIAAAQQQQPQGMANQISNPYIAQIQGMAAAQQQSNLGQAYAQRLAQQRWNQAMTPKKYMIDGVPMDFEEFCDTLYPDDCAEKTHLILKFKKEN